MVIKKILQLGATPLMVVALGAGTAAAATVTTVEETGPDSEQTVVVTDDNTVDLTNTNDTIADVTNDQTAESGTAVVDHNTTGEDAETGDADTEFAVVANVEHTNASSADFALNSGGAGGDVTTEIMNTGPDSVVDVTVENTNEVTVENTNTFDLTVDNTQESTTGDATVSDNTTGGGASTGDASSSASVEIDHFTSN